MYLKENINNIKYFIELINHVFYNYYNAFGIFNGE